MSAARRVLWLTLSTVRPCSALRLPPTGTGIAGPSTIRNSFRSFSSTPRRSGPRDHEINVRHVRVADSAGKLGSLLPLREVMSTINFSTHFVELVSANPPIVKVFDRGEDIRHRQAALAKSKRQRMLKQADREVQVSWTAADADLEFKLKMARRFMEEGDRATVVFAQKKGSKKKVSPDRQEEMVEMFNKGLGDIGTKWKDDDLRGRSFTAFWAPNEDLKDAAREKLDDRLEERENEKFKKREIHKARLAEQEAKIQRRLEIQKMEAAAILEERRRALGETEPDP